ncbi:MAG: lamin tail domain-containing protein [Pirellulales bacterium]
MRSLRATRTLRGLSSALFAIDGDRESASKRRRGDRRLLVEALEDRRVLDSTVVFNEVMFQPLGNNDALEWIELHNQQSVDMDLSGWRITGGVDYTFAAGTRIGGGDYLVVAASPADLQTSSGFAGAIGPYTGKLDNGGETIRLISIGGRTMDVLAYGDDGDWPVGPDGGGPSLAKLEPNLGTAEAANWTTSRQIGGTPGARNFPPQTPQIVETTAVPIDATWRYNQLGDQGIAWRASTFDDTSWPTGQALFHAAGATFDFPEPKRTPLTLGKITYYFRTTFEFTGDASQAALNIHPIVDDGAVYYLNGQEIYRQNMFNAPADVLYSTLAFPGVGNAGYTGPFTVAADDLVQGTNVLAVEVHQNNAGSNDITFAAELVLAETVVDMGADLPNLAINEVAGGTDGQFSVELYNRGATPLDLTGVVLTRAGTASIDYAVPSMMVAPGGYAPFTAAQLGFAGADGERLFLYTPGKAALLDAVVIKNTARGRVPDGDGTWRYVDALTPGAANVVTLHDEIVINEIMYHHRPIQPRSGQFDETPIFPVDATWKYDDTGTDRGAAWRSASYNDAAWASGSALLHSEAGPLPAPKNTELAPGQSTYYFRKSFDFAGDPVGVQLSLNPVVDDGAVFYLNGVEIYRQNMPAGDIDYGTSALSIVDNAGFSGPIVVAATGLVSGTNVLAVEVHQATAPTGGGPQIAPLAGYQIAWDGSDGDFYDPSNPALAPTNDALATNGVTPFGSSQYGAGVHLITNINDGRYGNSNSWLANFPVGDPNPYIGLNFGGTLSLSSIAWGRDNGNTVTDACGGTCMDRSLGVYTIQVTNVANPGTATTETGDDATGWETIGTLTYSNSGGGFTPYLRHRYTLAQNGSPIQATGLRIKVSDQNIAIDEIELNAAAGAGDSDVAFGLALSTVVETSPTTEYSEVDEEWIELYNRGGSAVDLTGWRIDDGIDFNFPAGTTIAPGGYLVVSNNKAALEAIYPGIDIVGDYSGGLANSGDRIVLKDPRNNVADDVRYFDGGRWSTYADGLGSSLELKDPDADNSRAEAWAASDESGKSSWHTYTYRGVATAEFPPARWNEFVMGLFGDGEILLDDISVVESPGTTAAQKIINGTFQADTIGQSPASWRINGNHRHSFVVADPDNPAQKVLKLVSTGQTQDRSNHAETTFIGNQPAVNGREYEISFRAKWIAGTDQFNTRLYFNRLARRTTIDSPTNVGTPGAPNSRLVANAGPTYDGFAQSPVVPALGQPVTVSVNAADPDGVASMMLRYSVNGGALVSTTMTHEGGGRYVGTIPGQASAGAIVQFFVEGTDALGAASTYPAAGADSRALYKVQDGQAQAAGKHSIRIIMTTADAQFMHNIVNVMSSEELRATVVYDEQEVYYNVGVSLKGSMAGRPSTTFVSFRIKFNADQKFRGVHEDIALDRSGRGAIVTNGQDELLHKQMIAAAGGGLPSQYDDLAYVISPLGNVNGSAILMLGEYSEVFLSEQYASGGDGTVFNYDLVYYQNNTANGLVDGDKIPTGYGHPSYNVDLEDLGDDKERYRFHYRIQNNRQQDDYSHLIPFLKAMTLTGSTNGGALDLATQATMDVDEWMRVFAAQSLAGAGPDLYGRGLPHNLRLYVRPEDGRVLALPWDWDLYAFGLSATADVFPSGNIRKVVDIPSNKRLFLGHLNDLMNTTFNSAYLSYWTTNFGNLLPGQNFTAALQYMDNRGAYVASQLPASVPFSASTGDISNATTLVDEPTAATALVPSVANGGDLLDASWMLPGFDDAAWQSGTTAVGYERASGYESLIGLDVLDAVDTDGDGTNENNSVYVRIPFDVADPSSFDRLKLRMKYDDGFVGFLNGVQVAQANQPATLVWNAAATASHADTDAVQFQEYDISAFRSALVVGENVLAIHGLNFGAGSSDMLISPQLVGEEIASGSENITVNGPTVTLGGSAWIDVHEIRLAGQTDPLVITYPTTTTWQATVPVAFGPQTLTFEAYDFQGNLVATDTVNVTSTFSDRPLEDFLRISELMYHPADPSAAETAAGFGDSDEFEFVELVNTSTTRTLDLTGVKFTDGITFDFTGSSVTSLAPGEYVLAVVNLAAFSTRYDTTGMNIAGQYSGRLNNAGERLVLVDGSTTTLHDFTYDDTWYPTTDGAGPSLVAVDLAAAKSQWNDASGWRASNSTTGSPGGPDSSADLLGDLNGDHLVGLADLAILQAHFGIASGALAADGDLNGDGAINRADAALLARQFGKPSTTPLSPSPAAAAIVRHVDSVLTERVSQAASELSARTASRRIAASTRNRPMSLTAAAIDASLGGDDVLRASRGSDAVNSMRAKAFRAVRRG